MNKVSYVDEHLNPVKFKKFFYQHKVTSNADKNGFLTHYHPCIEIYVYIQGDAVFQVESFAYELEPYDVMIVPAYRIHNPIPRTENTFERYVLNIFPEFFDAVQGTEYESYFNSKSLDNLKISGKKLLETNFLNILKEFDDHTKQGNIAMALARLTELLHIIKSAGTSKTLKSHNPIIQDIINYINKNFKYINNVSEVTKNFNYSKNHLSHMFKESTGITIPQYINIKRIENVKLLYKNGETLTNACIESGFNSYNNFAYIYKKKFGKSPSGDLKASDKILLY